MADVKRRGHVAACMQFGRNVEGAAINGNLAPALAHRALAARGERVVKGVFRDNRLWQVRDLVNLNGGKGRAKRGRWDADGPGRLRNLEGMRVRAFAVAGIGECARELNVFLGQVRWFHPEKRVYVVIDEDSLGELDGRWREDEGVTVEVLSRADLEGMAARVRAKDHGERWHVGGIAAKLHGWRRALEVFAEPVLMCDSDLTLCRRLPEHCFLADLVLSPHQGHWHKTNTSPLHGFYNAGMALARDPGIARRWEELFRSDAGGFYEQGCMDQLAGEYVTEVFPSGWNWGGWRNFENVRKSGRELVFAHTHIVGRWSETNVGPVQSSLRAVAREAVARRELAESWVRKVLFVHHPKAAGTSMMRAFRLVGRRYGWQVLDSWDYGLERDWTREELRAMASGSLWGQVKGGRWIAHQHAMNLGREELERFGEEGWRIVSLYRDPRERLVSGYYWGQDFLARKGRFPWGNVHIRPGMSLAAHVAAVLEHARQNIEPVEGHELVDGWWPATDAGMAGLVEDCFPGAEMGEAPRLNRSPNPGWDAAVECGEIGEDLVERVEAAGCVRGWDPIAEMVGEKKS